MRLFCICKGVLNVVTSKCLYEREAEQKAVSHRNRRCGNRSKRWVPSRKGSLDEELRQPKMPGKSRAKILPLRDFPDGPVADSVLPMLGASVRSLVRELDPTCCN